MAHTMSITAEQSRMARAALGWSIRETADRVQVGVNTLSRFESGGRAYTSTADALRSAYEVAGVEFVARGATSLAGGAGVRLGEGVLAHG
jgi:transcriptional regulator with XRE-family HTH domain